MINPDKEEVFRLSEGPERVGMSYAKLYKLIKNGRESVDGELVKLEYLTFENGMVTSVEAIARLRRRLSAIDFIDDVE